MPICFDRQSAVRSDKQPTNQPPTNQVLANATRLQLSSDIADQVHKLGVLPLVLLCASPISQVQRNAVRCGARCWL